MEKNNKKVADIDDFEKYINLYNIVSSQRAVELLRHIADETFTSVSRRPSILIVGKEGKTLLARAFLNSLIIEDIRECPSKQFDNGFSSKELFENSLYDTAHVITNYEQLRPMSEAVVWRYLRFGWCSYSNFQTRSRDYVHCNGILILTASSIEKVGKPILKAVKYTVQMEPYNQEQLFSICHQYLTIFCGIEYESEEVLQSICEYGNGEISRIYELLKLIMLILKTEDFDVVSDEAFEKALGLIA